MKTTIKTILSFSKSVKETSFSMFTLSDEMNLQIAIDTAIEFYELNQAKMQTNEKVALTFAIESMKLKLENFYEYIQKNTSIVYEESLDDFFVF